MAQGSGNYYLCVRGHVGIIILARFFNRYLVSPL